MKLIETKCNFLIFDKMEGVTLPIVNSKYNRIMNRRQSIVNTHYAEKMNKRSYVGVNIDSELNFKAHVKPL